MRRFRWRVGTSHRQRDQQGKRTWLTDTAGNHSLSQWHSQGWGTAAIRGSRTFSLPFPFFPSPFLFLSSPFPPGAKQAPNNNNNNNNNFEFPSYSFGTCIFSFNSARVTRAPQSSESHNTLRKHFRHIWSGNDFGCFRQTKSDVHVWPERTHLHYPYFILWGDSMHDQAG